MGVGADMFEGAFTALVVFGVLIGLGIAGLIWLCIWLSGHIHFAWVS